MKRVGRRLFNFAVGVLCLSIAVAAARSYWSMLIITCTTRDHTTFATIWAFGRVAISGDQKTGQLRL